MNADGEWTQAELRAHLEAMGWPKEDFVDGEIIPQDVKYVSNPPLTEADIARGQQLLAEHPEWGKKS